MGSSVDFSTASSSAPKRIAIIGAGASGVLLASAIARSSSGAEVTLIDPSPGRGVAYGDPRPEYLLNTRVGNMSLDLHTPGGFLTWLRANAERPEGWTADDFAPRARFGDYLEHRLAAVLAGELGGPAPRLVRERVEAAELSASQWRLRFSSGKTLTADVVVLATGWSRPRPLRFHGREEVDSLVRDDPWNAHALDGLEPGAEVLLIGSGLTALDVALAVWRKQPDAKVTALSRHGMLPRVHGLPRRAAPVLSPPYPTTARGLYAKLRAAANFTEADGALRHGVFLNLRDVAAEIWAGLAPDERRMFLRHFRRYWDIERHRLPPAQAETLQQAKDEGRFRLLRGWLAKAVRASDESARALVPAKDDVLPLTVNRIINCTGPDQDPFRSRNPLILDLLAQGWAAADELNLGLQVDDDGAVLGSGGQASPGLYALGPPTQGRFFEITGVPEIRAHAERLAARLGRTPQVPFAEPQRRRAGAAR